MSSDLRTQKFEQGLIQNNEAIKQQISFYVNNNSIEYEMRAQIIVLVQQHQPDFALELIRQIQGVDHNLSLANAKMLIYLGNSNEIPQNVRESCVLRVFESRYAALAYQTYLRWMNSDSKYAVLLLSSKNNRIVTQYLSDFFMRQYYEGKTVISEIRKYKNLYSTINQQTLQEIKEYISYVILTDEEREDLVEKTEHAIRIYHSPVETYYQTASEFLLSLLSKGVDKKLIMLQRRAALAIREGSDESYEIDLANHMLEEIDSFLNDPMAGLDVPLDLQDFGREINGEGYDTIDEILLELLETDDPRYEKAANLILEITDEDPGKIFAPLVFFQLLWNYLYYQDSELVGQLVDEFSKFNSSIPFQFVYQMKKELQCMKMEEKEKKKTENKLEKLFDDVKKYIDDKLEKTKLD